ncbi:hypothetical protein M1D89_20240 [Arthrobacter sp. D3-18]
MSAAHDELFQLMLGRTTTKAVERILAAGWVKPRTITTAEELDALPNESLILDARNKCREGLTSIEGRNWWRTMGPAKVLASKEISLPATVLHEGQS